MKNLDKLLELYFDFRNNDSSYNESYKWEILKDNNNEFKRIGNSDKLGFVSYIVEKSINLLDQRERYVFDALIEKTPDELDSLLEILFNESVSIENRIDQVTEKSKDVLKKAGRGEKRLYLRMIAYWLSSIDYTKYTLFMSSYFKFFVQCTDIEKGHIESDGARYAFYLDICNIIKDRMKILGYLDSPSLLDAQDFIMCFHGYDVLKGKVLSLLGLDENYDVRIIKIFTTARDRIVTEGEMRSEYEPSIPLV